jgi:hypothetical protein
VRRRLRPVAARAAAVVVVLGLCLLWAGGTRPVSERFLSPQVPLHAYRVVYRVNYGMGVVNEEVHVVSRPYDGLFLTRRGGRVLGGELTNAHGSYVYETNGTGGWALVDPGKTRATGDVQATDALNLAIERGDAVVLGTRRILGRRCTVVLTGHPAGEPIAAPTPSSRVVLCVDRTGVLLAERWQLDGKLAEDMRAIAFDPRFRPTSSTFAPSPRSPTKQPPLVAVTPVSAAQAAKLKPRLRPPSGFRFDGGHTSLQTLAGSLDVKTTLFYVGDGGLELLEVQYEQGPASHFGIPVTVAGGHRGYLQVELYDSTLSIDTGPGSSIALEGADPRLLVAAANRLVWPSRDRRAA